MLHLMNEASRSFVRAFVASVVVLLPGLLAAPDFATAKGLAIAAIIASVVAGLKALQVFVPQLSFKSISALGAYYVYVDSFVRAFLGTFFVAVIGVLTAPELSVTKSALVGLLVAAVAVGVRAVQGVLTRGDVPAPTKGLDVPAQKP